MSLLDFTREGGSPERKKIIMGIDKGGNMAGPLLAEALGGNFFLGFLSAVSFATILLAFPDLLSLVRRSS